MSLKNPVTPQGIDPGTVRLVAQCLNHYRMPQMIMYCNEIFRCTLADHTLLWSLCDTLYLVNKMVNGPLCDVVHSLDQDILCFQNDIWIHGTEVNVPVLMPAGRVWPSVFVVYKAHTCSDSFTCSSVNQNFTQISQPVWKVWIDIH